MKQSKLPILIAIGAVLIVGLLLALYFTNQDKSSDTSTKPVQDIKKSPEEPNDSKSSTENSQKDVINVAVYFAKSPQSDSDFTYTMAVSRNSDRVDIGTFALEQLIAGPTAAETDQGYYSPFKGLLSGSSSCDGKDFSLSVKDSVATVSFCRKVASSGVGDDARIKATVDSTLEQFSTVESVRILTQDGNCFGDASGQNKCLAE